MIDIPLMVLLQDPEDFSLLRKTEPVISFEWLKQLWPKCQLLIFKSLSINPSGDWRGAHVVFHNLTPVSSGLPQICSLTCRFRSRDGRNACRYGLLSLGVGDVRRLTFYPVTRAPPPAQNDGPQSQPCPGWEPAQKKVAFSEIHLEEMKPVTKMTASFTTCLSALFQGKGFNWSQSVNQGPGSRPTLMKADLSGLPVYHPLLTFWSAGPVPEYAHGLGKIFSMTHIQLEKVMRVM